MIISIEYDITIHTFTIYFCSLYGNESEYLWLMESKLKPYVDAGYPKSYGCFIHDYMLEEIDLSFKDLIDIIMIYNPQINYDGYSIYFKIKT